MCQKHIEISFESDASMTYHDFILKSNDIEGQKRSWCCQTPVGSSGWNGLIVIQRTWQASDYETRCDGQCGSDIVCKIKTNPYGVAEGCGRENIHKITFLA
jgi:hypothetical protein